MPQRAGEHRLLHTEAECARPAERMCRKMRESSESQRVAHEAQILNHSALLHCGEFKEPRLQKFDCPYRKLNLKKNK
jgi:hypothetical protein